MSNKGDALKQPRSIQAIRLLKPYTAWLALVVGLLFVLTFVDMAAPYFLKLLIDDVFPQAERGGNLHLLWLILPGMVVSYMARNGLFYASRMRSLRISEDLCFDLRKRLFEHLQRLNLSFYRTHQPGRLSARLMDDTFKIQSFIQDKLPTLIRYLLEFQILLILIYVMNWRLAIASTIVLPLHLATSHYFRGSIRKSHSEAQESLAQAHGNIVEKFLGMEVVKGFGAEERESRTFREAINASRESQIRSQRFHFSQKVVADLLVGLGTVVLLGYGTYNVVAGHMKSGEFLMFFLYVKMLYPAVIEIISGVGHLSKATASVDRVFEMLAEPTDEHEHPDRDRIDLSGHIEFRQVSFHYDEEGTPALHDLNFTIEPGEHVAITGPSGAGKSTLISLLPRFNDPTGGKILIDGQSADSLDLQTLRQLFGIVFQEVFLFNTSIYENLRYARPQATMEEIVEACKITGAHEFIQRLPDGYYSRIGSGSELSRGEKQRITLARALVKNPKILIIDEATASIDAPAAREIIHSILQMMQARTVIMVTHDTKLLDLVDRVISIDEGKMTYDGLPQQFDRFTPIIPKAPVPTLRLIPRRPRSRSAQAGPTSPSRASGPLASIVGLMLVLSLSWTSLSRAQEAQPEAAPEQVTAPTETPAAEQQPEEVAPAEPKTEETPAPIETPSEPTEVVVESAQEEPKVSVTVKSPEPEPTQTEPIVPVLPANASRLITLPRLSTTEMQELCSALELRLATNLGYEAIEPPITEALPHPPLGLTSRCDLARSTPQGTAILRLGIRPFLSQAPQCWIQGVTVTSQGTWTDNADLGQVEPAINEIIKAIADMKQNMSVRDLETKLVQLSYADAKTAVAMLKGMGITTMNQPTEIPGNVDFNKLPYVAIVPDPASGDTGLISKSSSSDGNFGLSLTPGVAADMTSNAVASPMTQLMVLFHPAHPEQFSDVRRLLNDYVDRPARQIFIEGMVLEINEEGLKDLGVDWQLNQSPLIINTTGALNAGGDDATFYGNIDNTSMLHNIFQGDFQWDWNVTLRALIREGKAEVLSRPSVLTLNNRQSTIRVGKDVPIAKSYEGAYNSSNKVAFSFSYLPTGILLNIRPRINEDGTEVSMLIDTIVSAQVPGDDLELKSSDGEILASAPTVSTRRVQTYGRIRNNTPFIIGGLVARQQTVTKDKVPFLGDLPLLGHAFRGQKNENTKTEVIIVVTPYILPENKLIPRSLPKDEDLFDSFGHKLFRDSYRIRAEDVFDLSFLLEDPRIASYRDKARQAVTDNFRLGQREPFRSFVEDNIPGESILVTRMIYEVIKRLDLADRVNLKRVIYMESQQASGYNVGFLEALLNKQAGGSFKGLKKPGPGLYLHHRSPVG